MFDENFCLFLEYHITGTLGKSDDIEKRRCWCDGIYLPEAGNDYSYKQVKKSKEIVTRAWMDEGKTKNKNQGQFIYEMKILFGEKSLEHYRDKKDLRECVPGVESDDWIMLDKENRIIEIQLL
jgi:hypothetical protein